MLASNRGKPDDLRQENLPRKNMLTSDRKRTSLEKAPMSISIPVYCIDSKTGL
jgi:hypothetical protein